MVKKPRQTQPDSFEGIEQALTRTERFIENNSKIISYVILGIVLVVIAYIGVNRFYITPLEEEATDQMYMAERFFERDSFNLALNGYGTYPGFLQITEDYRITKSANLAKFYAGICFLQMDNYESAIEYLEDFKTDDVLIGSAKYSALGDSYVELGEYERAVREYQKGISGYVNSFSTPTLLKKTGLVQEELQDFVEAVETYQRISREFPDSQEARDIQKYIARASQNIES